MMRRRYIRTAVILFSGDDPNEAEMRLDAALSAARAEEPDLMLVATYLTQAVRRGNIEIQSSTPHNITLPTAADEQ